MARPPSVTFIWSTVVPAFKHRTGDAKPSFIRKMLSVWTRPSVEAIGQREVGGGRLLPPRRVSL
jgi:hypothetical protein